MRVGILFRSFTARVVTLVLTGLALFAAALGVVAYTITRNWLEDTAVSHLEALAEARQRAIEERIEDYLTNLRSFLHPDLEDHVTDVLAAEGAEREAMLPELRSHMRRARKAYPQLVWAEVLDLDGRVLACAAPGWEEEKARTPKDRIGFPEGRERAFLSDPFPEAGKVFLHAAKPLGDARNNTIAVLLLRFDAKPILSIVGDYTGLGKTGETVLGARRGDEVHFLAPMRFDPNLSEIRPAPATGPRARPMIHATGGQTGTIEALDYRDSPVIAAYRPILPTGWGLVVKQDVAETMGTVGRMRTTMVIGAAALLALGALVSVPFVYSFTRPLRELEEATRRVAGGDLDTRVPTEAQDEVGRLAQSFNAMLDRLSRAHADLERKNEELSAFAYVISHDLRAPLRAISNLSTWLQEDLKTQLSDEHREHLVLLRDRVEHMDQLINGLLEFSRVGRVEGPNRRVSTTAVLQSVIASLEVPEGIEISVSADMPSMEADEIQLSQVFQNLIENAVKHHPGPKGRIEVRCGDADAFWEFSVRDDGAGIDPRHRERIFQIFQTLTPREQTKNTGIGLSLVRKVVEARGGRVWIESEGVPGEGSTFRFTWPKRPRS